MLEVGNNPFQLNQDPDRELALRLQQEEYAGPAAGAQNAPQREQLREFLQEQAQEQALNEAIRLREQNQRPLAQGRNIQPIDGGWIVRGRNPQAANPLAQLVADLGAAENRHEQRLGELQGREQVADEIGAMAGPLVLQRQRHVGCCGRICNAVISVIKGIVRFVKAIVVRAWNLAKLVVNTFIGVAIGLFIVGIILFIGTLVAAYQILRYGRIQAPNLRQFRQRLPQAWQNRIGNELGQQVARREELDPAINRAHFRVRLPVNEIPNPPAEVNLEELKHFYPDIDLTNYVDHVNVGCQGLVGAPPQGTPEAEAFAERIQKLAKNILWQLKFGEHEVVVKRSICENLADASGACAPRHMEDSELGYEQLSGDVQILTPEQKVIRITQKLRSEIVERLVHQGEGNVHRRTGILAAIGEEFQIPGYDAQQDMFEEGLNIQDTRQIFHAMYTADALIERLSLAVNTPVARNREIPRQEVIDWFKDHIPADYQPREEQETRMGNYLTEHVYTEEMDAIRTSGLRSLLVTTGILVQ